jgi:hypothetical protein
MIRVSNDTGILSQKYPAKELILALESCLNRLIEFLEHISPTTLHQTKPVHSWTEYYSRIMDSLKNPHSEEEKK